MCEDKEEARSEAGAPSPRRLCWSRPAAPLPDTRGLCCAKLLRKNGKPKKVSSLTGTVYPVKQLCPLSNTASVTKKACSTTNYHNVRLYRYTVVYFIYLCTSIKQCTKAEREPSNIELFLSVDLRVGGSLFKQGWRIQGENTSDKKEYWLIRPTHLFY